MGAARMRADTLSSGEVAYAREVIEGLILAADRGGWEGGRDAIAKGHALLSWLEGSPRSQCDPEESLAA